MNYITAKAIVSEWLQRKPVSELILRRNPSSEIPPKGSVLAVVRACPTMYIEQNIKIPIVLP